MKDNAVFLYRGRLYSYELIYVYASLHYFKKEMIIHHLCTVNTLIRMQVPRRHPGVPIKCETKPKAHLNNSSKQCVRMQFRNKCHVYYFFFLIVQTCRT
jgi:hypothetical protein